MEYYRQLRRLQNRIDVAKYYEGEKRQSDPCGTYEHCEKCDKEVMDPCARAMNSYAQYSNRSDKMILLRKLPRKQ